MKRKKRRALLTKEMSSSGCINLEVKPELDSGFLMVGAPVMVALALMVEAAAGKVGLDNIGGEDMGPAPCVELAADCKYCKSMYAQSSELVSHSSMIHTYYYAWS